MKKVLEPVERLGVLIQAYPDGERKELLLAILKEARDAKAPSVRLNALKLAGGVLGLMAGEKAAAVTKQDPRLGSVLKGLKKAE